ncbi:MAG: hypothetical protein ACI4OT_05465 [Bacilli bacterium]
MKTEKEMLLNDIKDDSIILDNYINGRYKYIVDTEYLDEDNERSQGFFINDFVVLDSST